MTAPNPATPAPAATPGSTPNVITPPSTPATPPQVPAPEGKVTISTKEFAQLSRDAARGRSAQRRNALGKPAATPPVDGSDPTAQAIAEANQRAEEAERTALQFQVKGKVGEILEKDEFKNIPKSTKAVILANPGILSQADNLEEALLDIEDYLRENVLTIEMPAAPGNPAPQPTGHEAPPVNPGSPAPSNPVTLEDSSKLTGPARSQAVLRNKLKQAKGTK